MDERDALEKLMAYLKCQKLRVRGVYEDCNETKCYSCNLCYMQGTIGEHIESVEIAIKALEDNEVQVVLMDIGLPYMNGIEATEIIKSKFPDIKVIMLTSHEEEDEVISSLYCGANAYVLKDISMDRLHNLIITVNKGSLWIDPQIAQIVQNTFSNNKPSEKVNFKLTSREKEVLQLMVQGLSNTQIADRIIISPHTVKAHVCNIFEKMAVTDRVQAAVKAVRHGIS